MSDITVSAVVRFFSNAVILLADPLHQTWPEEIQKWAFFSPCLLSLSTGCLRETLSNCSLSYTLNVVSQPCGNAVTMK